MVFLSFIPRPNVKNFDPGTSEIWRQQLGVHELVGAAASKSADGTNHTEYWAVFRPGHGLGGDFLPWPQGMAPDATVPMVARTVRFRWSVRMLGDVAHPNEESFKWSLHGADDITAFATQFVGCLAARYEIDVDQVDVGAALHFYKGDWKKTPLTQAAADGISGGEIKVNGSGSQQVYQLKKEGASLVGRVYAERQNWAHVRRIHQIAARPGLPHPGTGYTDYEKDGDQALDAFLSDAILRQDNDNWLFSTGTVERVTVDWPSVKEGVTYRPFKPGTAE